MRIAVVASDIYQQPLLVLGTEGVAMEGTAQRGGELGLHVISLQPYAVIAGVSLLAPVGEVGCEVARIEDACDGQYGNVKLVPVSLGRMSEGIYLAVLVLIARATVIHGHRSGLHHGVGQRGTGIGLGSPGPLGLGVGVTQVGGFPQCGCSQKGVDVAGEAGIAGGIGRLAVQACTQKGKQGHDECFA